MGDFRVVLKDEMPDISFRDTLSLLKAHEILCFAWAVTGTAMQTSKLGSNSQVPECSLTEAISYHSFCKEQIRLHPGPPAAAIRWFLERDRATRLAAVQLYQSGFPWGEALQQARETKTAVLWQCATSSTGGVLPLAVDPDPDRKRPPPKKEDPGKRPRVDKSGKQTDLSTGKLISLADICGDWNSARRCTAKQRDCPKQKLHRCHAKVADNAFCGAWQHKACRHPTSKHQ
ncbi:unnamed protein product [Symbiodinium microadriaticum]|nr:unnamed protein product [Symbiodinium microadriaticum]